MNNAKELRTAFLKYARAKGWWESWGGNSSYLQLSDASANFTGVDLWSIVVSKRGPWCVIEFNELFQDKNGNATAPTPTDWPWKSNKGFVNGWRVEHKIAINEGVFDEIWNKAKQLYPQLNKKEKSCAQAVAAPH